MLPSSPHLETLMSAITLARAKEYLRVTSTDATLEDIIQLIIDAAEDVVKRHCGTELAETSKTEIVPGGMHYFSLACRPVVSASSVYHIDTEYSYSAGDWVVKDSRVYLATSAGNPSSSRWPAGQYEITYTGGYSTVPSGILQATLLLIARMYDNRGGMGSLSAGGGSQGWGAALAPGSDLAILLEPYTNPSVVGR